MIIALCGFKGSGKTSLAKLLSGEEKSQVYIKYQYCTRKSFAEPLYLMIETLLTYQGATKKEINYLFTKGKEEPTSYLDGRSVRHAVQTLGTEWGRELITPCIWVKAWENAIKNYPYIVTDDMRFLNEAMAVRNHHGILIRIERPGVKQDIKHISEIEQLRINVDHTIVNDGEPDDMVRELDAFLRRRK